MATVQHLFVSPYTVNYITKPVHCLANVSSWVNSSWLMLNFRKTEALLVGRGEHLEEFGPHCSLFDLKVHTNNCLSQSAVEEFSWITPWCSAHIQASVSNAFYHLQLARGLHSTLADDDLASVTHGFMTSWWYFSNAIYQGIKPSALRKRQLVQNAAPYLLSNGGCTISTSNLSSAFHSNFL